jgi:hypothetical protein
MREGHGLQLCMAFISCKGRMVLDMKVSGKKTKHVVEANFGM